MELSEINVTREVILRKLGYVLDHCSEVCGVTLTFSRKFKLDDHTWLHRFVQKELLSSKLWKGIKYILIPEFTPNGDLHYHGIIWDEYQCVVMRLLQWWRRKFGYVKPELKLKHPMLWLNYIIKDYGKTGLWTLYRIKEKSLGSNDNPDATQ